MADQETVQRLLAMLNRMKIADISVLEAALHYPSGEMATTEGSDNDRLWSELEKLGWMRETPSVMDKIAKELGRTLPEKSKNFTLLDAGRGEIGSIMELQRKQTGREISKVREIRRTPAAPNALTVINPVVAFLNFTGDKSYTDTLLEDRKALAPFFSLSREGDIVRPCHVLFLYGKLDKNGVFPKTQLHVRDIAKKLGAYLVVLASEHPNEVLLNGFPWKERTPDWSVDLMFINNRNGTAFVTFFSQLFTGMFAGKSFSTMLGELAPQGVAPDPKALGFVFPLGVGLYTFKNQPENPHKKLAEDFMREACLGFQKDGKTYQKIADALYQKLAAGQEFHMETAMSQLGALSGMGCQMAVKYLLSSKSIVPGPEDKTAALSIATKDGAKWFFGDLLNLFLMEGSISAVGLVSWNLPGMGEAPDVREISGHVSKTIGGSEFGQLRIPDIHQPREKPLETLGRHFQPLMRAYTATMAERYYFGWIFALAAQKLILQHKGDFSPALAARIFAESAIAFSKPDADQFFTQGKKA